MADSAPLTREGLARQLIDMILTVERKPAHSMDRDYILTLTREVLASIDNETVKAHP